MADLFVRRRRRRRRDAMVLALLWCLDVAAFFHPRPRAVLLRRRSSVAIDDDAQVAIDEDAKNLAAAQKKKSKRRVQRDQSQALGFWDEARLEVEGGDGGDGCLAFRREKGIPLGGPSGGNGGRGGSVVIVCDAALNTLGVARRKTKYRGPSGANGLGSSRHARAERDVCVRVPPGTVVREDETGKVAGEVLEDGEALVVARGGRGGRGNAAFKTNRLTAPKLAERGERGARRLIKLELSLAADVGIVGKPNAGKSTLLAAATAARPKIADYSFTTLVPNLGVWEPSAYARSRSRRQSQSQWNQNQNQNQWSQNQNRNTASSSSEEEASKKSAPLLGVRARRSVVGGATKRGRAKREKRLSSLDPRRQSKDKRRKKQREDEDAFDFYGDDDDAFATPRPEVGNVVDEFAARQLSLATQRDYPEEEKTPPPKLKTTPRPVADERGLVLADVPGLIEDAHAGKGMGDAFLKHVERCSVLLHVVDLTARDPVADFFAIERELQAYSATLAGKPRVVALNKVDAATEGEASARRVAAAIRDHSTGNKNHVVASVSAAAKHGVEDLMCELRDLVHATTAATRRSPSRAKEVDLDPPFPNSRANPDRSWTLTDGRDLGYDGQWRIDSPRLEKIADMTNFDQPDAVARFARVLDALGLAQALDQRGAQPGDLVMIGDHLDLQYDPFTWSRVGELDLASRVASDDLDDDDGFFTDFLDDDDPDSFVDFLDDDAFDPDSFVLLDDDDDDDAGYLALGDDDDDEDAVLIPAEEDAF